MKVTDLAEFELLDGLSRLDDILVDYENDTAVLEFSYPDRARFFGTLYALYERGGECKGASDPRGYGFEIRR